MAWGESFDRGLAALQYGARVPITIVEPRVLSSCVEIDYDEVMRGQILQLVTYDKEDPFIGMEYWREVRRNWSSLDMTGAKFQKLVSGVARVIIAEENAGNVEYHQDVDLYRTLRKWGFYA